MRSHQVEPFAVKEVEAADSDQEGEDKMGIWKKFGFAWVTLGFLVLSLIGHWIFGWFAWSAKGFILASRPGTFCGWLGNWGRGYW
jgi:hypothetical protein